MGIRTSVQLTLLANLLFLATALADPCSAPIKTSSIYSYSGDYMSVHQYSDYPYGGTATGPFLSVYLSQYDYNTGIATYYYADVPKECLKVTGGSVSASCSVQGQKCSGYDYSCVPATITVTASGKVTLSYSYMSTNKYTYTSSNPGRTVSTSLYKTDGYTCSSSCSFTITVSNPDDITDPWASSTSTSFYIDSGFSRPRYCY